MDSISVTQKYPCVIPTVIQDYERAKDYFKTFFDMLPICEIILIGPDDVQTQVDKDINSGFFEDYNVSFIREDSLVPLSSIKPIFNAQLKDTTQPNPSSINWYYQQFLKMAYAQICDSDYYLCWDSDTIPLRKIKMFNDDGKPYLDTKSECNQSYFATIERILGFNKIIEKSFISEHMLFSKNFMLELIDDILKANYPGDTFPEKIIYSLGNDNLVRGFSEFETYGTFIGMKHPSAYKLRAWKSFRNLGFFVSISNFSKADKEWLSKDYDAVTFEKYQETEPLLNELFLNPRYREKLTSEQFFLSVLESGALGEYSNGTIKQDDLIAPV